MEHQWNQFRRGVLVVGSRLNGSSVLFASLSLPQMTVGGHYSKTEIYMWLLQPGNTVLPLSVRHHILRTKSNHLMLASRQHSKRINTRDWQQSWSCCLFAFVVCRLCRGCLHQSSSNNRFFKKLTHKNGTVHVRRIRP